MEVGIDELKNAVERMHGCSATLLESVSVHEQFQGKTVWQGEVQVFALINHPSAERCYAWSSTVEGSEKRRFFAVLHRPPLSSALDPVRAAIIQEYRESQKRETSR